MTNLKRLISLGVYLCTGYSVYFMSYSIIFAIIAMFFVLLYGLYEYDEGRAMGHKAFDEVFSKTFDPEHLQRLARMVEKVEI